MTNEEQKETVKEVRHDLHIAKITRVASLAIAVIQLATLLIAIGAGVTYGRIALKDIEQMKSNIHNMRVEHTKILLLEEQVKILNQRVGRIENQFDIDSSDLRRRYILPEPFTLGEH